MIWAISSRRPISAATRDGQLGPGLPRGDQRGEVGRQVRVDELVEVLGPAEVPEVVLAEVQEPGARRQPLDGQRRRRCREQHLAAVPGRHDPRRAVDGRSRSSRRRAAPPRRSGCPMRTRSGPVSPHGSAISPRCGREARGRGIDAAGEDRHHAVAGGLDHGPAGASRWRPAGSRRGAAGPAASRPGTAPRAACCPRGR